MPATTHQSFCRMCHSACPILVDVEDGIPVKVAGDKSSEIYHGYSARSLIVEDGAVKGVRLAEVGLAHDGTPKGNHLPAEELRRDLKGSFGSLLGTLRHLLWGESSWLTFWTTGAFRPALTEEEYPDLPSIAAAWSFGIATPWFSIMRITVCQPSEPRQSSRRPTAS